MRSFISIAAALVLAACAGAPEERAEAPASDASLALAIAGDWRSPGDRSRDQYRHPAVALAFWGLESEMTIVEIAPGGGWWTHILAPYARMTSGRYVSASGDLGAPNVSEAARSGRAEFLSRFSDAGVYGHVEVVDFSMRAGLALPDQSADFILVARAFHNWARTEGATDRFMREFARVLRPGGVLAVEQHRAAPGANVADSAPTGYVPEAYVIDAASRAGLVLAARSELNANPQDTRDHPFGVWTLPPIARTSPQGAPPDPSFDRSRYDAIGESDRMTLRFVKPE
ncbi:MAG: class I SAM-dependent methyltransferase [Phycisphaerales bacterium]|nr:class I SAM-dependent methyltransferase [Hyphomonadaceae bacterium]